MLYEKSFLMKNFKENAEGLTEGQFIRKKAHELVKILSEHDGGRKLFQLFGPYWEHLYPILEKYVPDMLKNYSKIAGPFNAFNDAVKETFDYGSEILNFMAALQYYDQRITGLHTPEEVHILEINDDDYPYLPNQYVDKSYLGRE